MTDLADLVKYGPEGVRMLTLAKELEAGGASGFASIARRLAAEHAERIAEERRQADAWRQTHNALVRIGRQS